MYPWLDYVTLCQGDFYLRLSTCPQVVMQYLSFKPLSAGYKKKRELNLSNFQIEFLRPFIVDTSHWGVFWRVKDFDTAGRRYYQGYYYLTGWRFLSIFRGGEMKVSPRDGYDVLTILIPPNCAINGPTSRYIFAYFKATEPSSEATFFTAKCHFQSSFENPEFAWRNPNDIF